MIEEPPILTVKRDLRRPSDQQIAAFRDIPTGFVVDALDGSGAVASNIKPAFVGDDPTDSVAGPALTANCGPADILATLAALRFVQPGDVVVSAFDGYQGCAAAGDILCGMMKNCGAAAFVTDGPVRDLAGIVDVGLPVWCTGVTPASPHTSGPGSVGLPIQIGGRQVETGDMVVADRDGVVIVPHDYIDNVIERLAKVQVLEADLEGQVANGLRIPDDIDKILESDAVRFVD